MADAQERRGPGRPRKQSEQLSDVAALKRAVVLLTRAADRAGILTGSEQVALEALLAEKDGD